MKQTYSHYPACPPPVALPLVTVPPHPCSYLPGRLSSTRAFMVRQMPAAMYQAFMDAGFRRSGHLVYQPACIGCRECLPLRVIVPEFKPDKSQRRCRRRNADLRVSLGRPTPTEEKFQLYQRYLRDWHGRQDLVEESQEAFEAFLYESPVDTVEFCYRDAEDHLLAVGICDVSAAALSSVYCYFDPAHAVRGLGTFAAIRELDYAFECGMSHYYLGYWVYGCSSMVYKAGFKPYEMLCTDGVWRADQGNGRDRNESAQ